MRAVACTNDTATYGTENPPQTCPELLAYDTSCDGMLTQPADINPSAHHDQRHYFNRKIPRIVHQIWFGDPNAMHRSQAATWQAFAQDFNYVYKLWTEDDLTALQAIMPQHNAELVVEALEAHNYPGASDLVRLSLLATYGGVYADIDISAPSDNGQKVDLAELVPMRNIVFVTEHDGRNIGSQMALFVANGFMMAAPNHPLMQHLEQTVGQNAKATLALGRGAPHATGPFFVNRSLAGAITILPITYLERFHCIH